MPFTINGCGNAYHGFGRAHVIQGHCEFCGQWQSLKSYDTTNYVVILFVPLIPLGKLRVLNHCPSCNKFRCLSLKDWEVKKADAIAEMKLKLASDDDSTEPVIRALQTAMAFQDPGLLDTVYKNLAKNMTEELQVQLSLSAALSYFGRHAEAAESLQNVLRINPSDEISDQLATAYMRSGNPTAAEPFAKCVLASGTTSRMWVPALLIHSYQSINEHEKALEWLNKLESTSPEYTSSRDFQKSKKSIEKAAKKGKPVHDAFLSGNPTVSYTKSESSRWHYFIGPAIAIALVALFIGFSIYRGSRHTVYLVNSIKLPYEVNIGGQLHKIGPAQRKRLELGEGDWQIAPVPNPSVEIQPAMLSIHTSFFVRPFWDPIYVINPDRMGIFTREKTYYAKNPGDAPPGESTLMTGQPTYRVEPVDHVFEPFPLQMTVKGGRTTSRTRLAEEYLNNNETMSLIGLAMDPEMHVDAAEYLESRIRYFGDDEVLLSFLSRVSLPERFLAFVSKFLDEEPRRLAMHRVYQNVKLDKGQVDEVRSEYAKRLEANPDSPELQYLYVRLLDNAEEQDAIWRKLVENKKTPDFVIASCSFVLMSRGEFDKALKLIDARMKVSNGLDASARLQRLSILEATRNWDRMIESCKEIDGMFVDAAARNEARAVFEKTGNKSAAMSYVDKMLNSAEIIRRRGNSPGMVSPEAMPAVLKAHIAYAAKDFKNFEALTRASQSPDVLDLDVAKGEIEKYADTENDSLSWEDCATIAIAAHLKGNFPLRDSMISRVHDLLAAGGYHDRNMAKLLNADGVVDAKSVANTFGNPDSKRLIATCALIGNKQADVKLVELARRYNFQKSPPYWLINDVLDKLDDKSGK